MHNYLFIGDVHAELRDLIDCERFCEFVLHTAIDTKSVVVWLGDLYHNHGIISSEVMWFWHNVFEKFADNNIQSIVIRGNHDHPIGQIDGPNSLITHKNQRNCHVVDYQPMIHQNILFIPFQTSNDKFVEICNKHKNTQIVVAHQTFIGSKYENGFYTQDGINADLISQKLIISGHIHAKQSFRKVLYVGSPRWKTLNDANQHKSILFCQFDPDNHEILKSKEFSTDNVCRKINHIIIDKDTNIGSLKFNKYDKYHVDINGTKLFIKEASELLKLYKNVKIRTFCNERVVSELKESAGLANSLNTWLELYKPKFTNDQNKFRELVKTRLSNNGI